MHQQLKKQTLSCTLQNLEPYGNHIKKGDGDNFHLRMQSVIDLYDTRNRQRQTRGVVDQEILRHAQHEGHQGASYD